MKPLADPLEALGRTLGASGERPEAWTWIAFAHAVAAVGLALFLGARTGGPAAIAAYAYGRDVLALSALLTLAAGLAWSLLRRPVLRRRRAPALVALVLVVGAASTPLPFPTSHEGHESPLCFRLPITGEWTVFWGGEGGARNRLASYLPDRRYGLDLVVADEGRTHRGDGLALEDYHAYGREVLAPADGEVVRVVDGLPDTPPRRAVLAPEPFGNHVVLRVAPERFVFLGHLLAGSIAVREGQVVTSGTHLARVGNSGFSRFTPEPHLALHLQDTPLPRRGEAVPWRFCAYEADGREVERGLPSGGIGPGGALLGQRVRPLAP